QGFIPESDRCVGLLRTEEMYIAGREQLRPGIGKAIPRPPGGHFRPARQRIDQPGGEGWMCGCIFATFASYRDEIESVWPGIEPEARDREVDVRRTGYRRSPLNGHVCDLARLVGEPALAWDLGAQPIE